MTIACRATIDIGFRFDWTCFAYRIQNAFAKWFSKLIVKWIDIESSGFPVLMKAKLANPLAECLDFESRVEETAVKIDPISIFASFGCKS